MLLRQISRYAVVGLANTFVGLSIIFVLHLGLGVSVIWANVFGYLAGFALGYVWNRRWTFGYTGDVRRSAFRYACLVVFAFGINLGLVLLLSRHMGVSYPIAQTLGVGTYSGVLFLGSRYIVFPTK